MVTVIIIQNISIYHQKKISIDIKAPIWILNKYVTHNKIGNNTLFGTKFNLYYEQFLHLK